MDANEAIIKGFTDRLLVETTRDTSSLKDDVALMPHQETAAQKAVDRDGSILFAHKVGTGKTLTSIAAFEKLKQSGKAKKALVVTPASLRENFVMNGVNKFTTSSGKVLGNAQEVRSQGLDSVDNPSKADYHVVSYDMFRKDPIKYINNTQSDTVIYDELHKIKNDSSATYKALKEARPHHRNFIGLTGSVISNNPSDIVPLIDAMTNGEHRLGTKSSFKNRFIGADKKGREFIREPRRLKAMLNQQVDFVESTPGIDKNLPKKIIAEEYVEMSPHQAHLYRYVMDKLDPIAAAKIRLGMSDLKKKDIAGIFKKIIQARQVSNSIHTVDESYSLSRSAKETPKVKKLIDDVQEHLTDTSDGHAVVHSELIKGGIDVLEQGFKDRGIATSKFIGKGQPGVTEEKRQSDVQDYLDGKNKVMLISGAGSEGLSLNNTTMVASLDGHFNPERLLQAEARGIRADSLMHRDPEDRNVLVKRYISTVPRSITETAKNVMGMVNPSAILGRVFQTKDRDPVPVIYNPFKKPVSADQWVYSVANKKLKLNKEFTDVLNKTSAIDYSKSPGFHSDKMIMDRYWDELGDTLDKQLDIGAEFEDRKNTETEQQYISELRDYYTAAGKGNYGMLAGAKSDDDLKKGRRIMTLGTTTMGALAGAQIGLRLPGLSLKGGLKLLGATAALGGLGGMILAARDKHTGRYYGTSKTKAKKQSKFTDEQLRHMLRGLSITEKQKDKEFHI